MCGAYVHSAVTGLLFASLVQSRVTLRILLFVNVTPMTLSASCYSIEYTYTTDVGGAAVRVYFWLGRYVDEAIIFNPFVNICFQVGFLNACNVHQFSVHFSDNVTKPVVEDKRVRIDGDNVQSFVPGFVLESSIPQFAPQPAVDDLLVSPFSVFAGGRSRSVFSVALCVWKESLGRFSLSLSVFLFCVRVFIVDSDPMRLLGLGSIMCLDIYFRGVWPTTFTLQGGSAPHSVPVSRCNMG